MSEETLAERVRALRSEQGLTQEELARLAGVRTQAVNLIENGKRQRPEPGTLRGLAHALGTTPVYLEYGVESNTRRLPPLRAYLRRVADLEPDQIAVVERTLRAFSAERRLRDMGHTPHLIAEPKAAYDREVPPIDEWPPVDEPPNDEEPPAQEEGD